jgi:hypothetical protein
MNPVALLSFPWAELLQCLMISSYKGDREERRREGQRKSKQKQNERKCQKTMSFRYLSCACWLVIFCFVVTEFMLIKSHETKLA